MIPTLTHDQLRAFHATHYHPSNAAFMSYGSFVPRLHAVGAVCDRFVSEKKLLSDQQKRACMIGEEPLWNQPRKVFVTCPEGLLLL